jgi:hypothetical protein
MFFLMKYINLYLLAFVFSFFSYGILTAEDFRVENRVFPGDGKEPTSQSYTVFNEGIVYDFLHNPAETIILEKGKFCILDDMHKVRTEITTAELDGYMRQLKEILNKSNDPLIKFLADPIFNEQYSTTTQELKLESNLVTYKVAIVSAKSPATAVQYREFTDLSAKLNSILIRGARPPFARLHLNELIAQHGAIPREVTLTINTVEKDIPHTATVRSEHQFSITLTNADMDRIKRARQAMNSYKSVTFEKYRQSE